MKNILFIISLLITYNLFSQTFNNEVYYGDELCQTAQNALISKSSFLSTSKSNKTFSNLNIEPVSLETVLSDYLWKYRPEGEFSDAAKQK